MPSVKYQATVLAPEAEVQRFASRKGWAIDEQASEAAPDGACVMRLNRSLADPGQASEAGLLLGKELSDHGLQPVGVVANLVGGDEALGSAKEIWQHMWPPVQDIGEGVPSPTTSPTKDGGPPDDPDKGGEPTTPDKASASKAAEAETQEQSPNGDAGPSGSDCCEAQSIEAALGALADPATIWPWAEEGERGELARKVLPDLYSNRSQLGDKATWLISPEMTLLERSAEGNQEALAEELLRARGRLTGEHARMRSSRADLMEKKVELEGKEVELAGKRVELAEKGVGLAGEMLAQMQKWRSIANWGIAFLCITTAFSMLAAAYVLLKLMPDKDVSDVAAPIIVFVLALFAISPAVLLLRERPLEGLDKWSPGGGDSGDTGGSSKEGEGDDGSGSPGEGEPQS